MSVDLEVVVVPFEAPKRRTTMRSTIESKAEASVGNHVEVIMATTSDFAKDVMIAILYLVIFFDVIGGSILAVSTPLLYNPAGTCPKLSQLMALLNRTSLEAETPQESLSEGLGMFAAAGRAVGVAAALNMGSSLFKSFAVLAKLLAAPLAARLGKKCCLLIYTYGGALAYFLTYASKPNMFNAPWPYFLAMRALTGFVGGSTTIVTMLISDFYSDPAKRQVRVGVMALSHVAAHSVGPLIGNAMIGSQPGGAGITRPFQPLLFACAGSLLAGVAVSIVVKVPPKHDSEKKPAEELATEKSDAARGQGYQKWVYCVFAGRILSSLADGSFTYLVTVAFWQFALQSAYSFILVTLSGLAFVVLPLAFFFKRKVGYATTCASAQIFGGVILALTPLAGAQASYLALFFAYQVSTMFPLILRSNMVLDIVPRDRKDQYISIADAFDDTASAVAPYVFVSVLLNEGWGPYHIYGPDHEMQRECDGSAGSLLKRVGMSELGIDPECGCMGGVGSNAFPRGSYLTVCAAVCILAAVPYLALLARFPIPWLRKPKVEPTPAESRLKEMALYRDSGETGSLPLRDLWAEWCRIQDLGLEPVEQRFGRWQDDKAKIKEIKERSKEDWKWLYHEQLPQQIARFEKTSTIEDKFVWLEEVEFMKKRARVSPDQRREIGEWFVDYLQWAGYGNPASMPRGWKDIITSAFPPLHYENGVENPKYAEDPLPHLVDISSFVNNLLHLEETRRFGRDFKAVAVERAVVRPSAIF